MRPKVDSRTVAERRRRDRDAADDIDDGRASAPREARDAVIDRRSPVAPVASQGGP